MLPRIWHRFKIVNENVISGNQPEPVEGFHEIDNFEESVYIISYETNRRKNKWHILKKNKLCGGVRPHLEDVQTGNCLSCVCIISKAADVFACLASAAKQTGAEGGGRDGRQVTLNIHECFFYGKHKLASIHSNYGPDSGSSTATDCSMWRQNVGTRGQLRPGV